MRLEVRQITCCAVDRIDTSTHSRLTVRNCSVLFGCTHTITCPWNKLCPSLNGLIMDLTKDSRNATCQARANHMVVIVVFFIQHAKSVFRLEKLKRLRYVHAKPVGVVHTSENISWCDMMCSGAFLTSSISSTLAGNTIHRRKVGILNRPGFD